MGWVCGVTRWAWDGVGMWSDQVVMGWMGVWSDGWGWDGVGVWSDQVGMGWVCGV